MKRHSRLPISLMAPSTPQPRWPLLIPLERAGEAAIPWRPLSMKSQSRRITATSINRDKCMPRAFLTIVFALCISHTPVTAEDKMVVDMSKMTCGELTKLGFQDFAGITMWLSGYYNASVRNTVIDLYQFAEAAKTVKDFCQTSPQSTVMSAAERALGIKMPRAR